jgi:hypothetical protein
LREQNEEERRLLVGSNALSPEKGFDFLQEFESFAFVFGVLGDAVAKTGLPGGGAFQ